MRIVVTRLIAIALFGAVAFTGFETAPVAASTPGQILKFTGVYRMHIGTADGKFGNTFAMVFLGNGTGTDPFGDQVRWSHNGRHFSFTAFPLDESWIVVADGIRNRNGFNSRKNPGTLKFIFTGATSTWFAVKLRDAPPS